MSNSYENMKKFLSLLFLIAFAITIQNTYAETFSIEPVSGSGAPGCEETLQGCYTPKELIIHVGDIVKFTNTDTASHTFTSGTPEGGTSGIFDSGLTTGGGGVSYSPDAVGDIPYWCVVHPWMVGVIKVVDYDDSTEIQYSRTHVESANIFSETESTISFGIDRSKYFINDSISIIGNLNYFVADEKPIIIILNPSGGIVYEKQVNIENKRFYDLVHTADSDFTKNGIYEIIISYDNEVDSKLSFDFSNNVPTSSKNITYYLSTSTINKIPLNANLVNVDFLSLSTFNQKGKLQFTLVPDLITQAKETITLDIPRKLFDAKDDDGNDIPFEISYIFNSGDLFIPVITEEPNDLSRKITLSFDYTPKQKIITIQGTHVDGLSVSLEPEPGLEKTVRMDMVHFPDTLFHLDSDGNFIISNSASWMKFNQDGKLLLETNPQLDIDVFYADSNDNLFTNGYTHGPNTYDTIHKFSKDFKLLDVYQDKDNSETIPIQNKLKGIDDDDNILYEKIIANESFKECVKMSSSFESFEIVDKCDFIKSKKNTDSNGNYYSNVYGKNIFCKFSSNNILLGQFSVDGTSSTKQDMAMPEEDLECKNSQLFDYRNLIVDSNDNVYAELDGIQKFSPDLRLTMILKTEFKDKLLAVDDFGKIYVKDSRNSIKIYSPSINLVIEEPTKQTEPSSSGYMSNSKPLEGALELQRQRIESAEANPASGSGTSEQDLQKEIASFVDQSKDPQSYVDRYENEPSYKEWFDENYSDYTIYEAVGLEEPTTQTKTTIDPEPEFTLEPTSPDCGTGTILKDGLCVVDTSNNERITTEDPRDSNGGGCLIATATYGSELSPEVQKLRELRDNSLLQTDSGTNFMNTFNDVYYSFSPIIADYERENPVFKEMVKITITPLLSSLSVMQYADSESEVLGIGISVILLNLGMYFVAPAMIFYRIKKMIS